MSAEATVHPAEHLRFSPIPTLLPSGTDLGEGSIVWDPVWSHCPLNTLSEIPLPRPENRCTQAATRFHSVE